MCPAAVAPGTLSNSDIFQIARFRPRCQETGPIGTPAVLRPSCAPWPARSRNARRRGELRGRRLGLRRGQRSPRGLLDDDDRLRRFVNVYVNDDDVRFLEDLATPTPDGSNVSIIPAVAGG